MIIKLFQTLQAAQKLKQAVTLQSKKEVNTISAEAQEIDQHDDFTARCAMACKTSDFIVILIIRKWTSLCPACIYKIFSKPGQRMGPFLQQIFSLREA